MVPLVQICRKNEAVVLQQLSLKLKLLNSDCFLITGLFMRDTEHYCSATKLSSGLWNSLKRWLYTQSGLWGHLWPRDGCGCIQGFLEVSNLQLQLWKGVGISSTVHPLLWELCHSSLAYSAMVQMMVHVLGLLFCHVMTCKKDEASSAPLFQCIFAQVWTHQIHTSAALQTWEILRVPKALAQSWYEHMGLFWGSVAGYTGPEASGHLT